MSERPDSYRKALTLDVDTVYFVVKSPVSGNEYPFPSLEAAQRFADSIVGAYLVGE